MKKMILNGSIVIKYEENSTKECIVFAPEDPTVVLASEEIKLAKKQIKSLLKTEEAKKKGKELTTEEKEAIKIAPIITESEKDLIYYIYRAYKTNKHPYKTIDELFKALTTSYYRPLEPYTVTKIRRLIVDEAHIYKTTYSAHLTYIISLYKDVLRNDSDSDNANRYKPRANTVLLYKKTYEKVKQSAKRRGLTVQQEASRALAEYYTTDLVTEGDIARVYETDRKRRVSISLPESVYSSVLKRATEAGTNVSYEIVRLILGGEKYDSDTNG